VYVYFVFFWGVSFVVFLLQYFVFTGQKTQPTVSVSHITYTVLVGT